MIRHAVAPVYLIACLLLGGASAAGFIANLILQIAALPLIGWALWQIVQEPPPVSVRAPLGLLFLLVAIALLQLVPLPPAVWTWLPGREAVAKGYRLLDIPLPWLPLTLTPGSALASLLWLLPSFAILLSIAILGAFRGRGIAVAIIAVTLASVALGALQVIGGTSTYFYHITNYGNAVGFFANANHNATLLLVCIPFLAALQLALLKKGRSTRNASAIRLLVGAAYAVIFVGLIINSSLAGIALGIPVAMTTFILFSARRRAPHRGLIAANLVISAAALVTIAIGPFGNNLFGHQTANVELSRQTSFALTLRAAREYFPLGSGVGSFQPVYRTQEPLETITTIYMNHAHSDWLEILLETGLPGIALASLFMIWWVYRAHAIWTADEPDYFAQAALVASAAILLHSVVDYPLRTAALSAVFAACIGLMSGVRPVVKARRTQSSVRHLQI